MAFLVSARVALVACSMAIRIRVALQQAPGVAVAAGMAVGVFLGWAVEKRWG